MSEGAPHAGAPVAGHHGEAYGELEQAEERLAEHVPRRGGRGEHPQSSRAEDRHETGPHQNEKAEHERLGSVDHCDPLEERRGRTVPAGFQDSRNLTRGYDTGYLVFWVPFSSLKPMWM